MKLNKVLVITILTFVFTFYSCAESDDSNVNQEMNDDVDSFTGTRTFTASGSGTGNLTISLCEFPFTSVTESLKITLNYEKNVLISGTYTLDIKTEVGTPVSADDVVCNIDPTFDENHTGNLTISDENISFSTNIGSSKNLTNVTYTFAGSATETSYTGSIEHASLNLDKTVTYNLNSETVID